MTEFDRAEKHCNEAAFECANEKLRDFTQHTNSQPNAPISEHRSSAKLPALSLVAPGWAPGWEQAARRDVCTDDANTGKECGKDTDWIAGALNVASNFVEGAVQEFVDEPGQVAIDAVEGVLIGTAVALLPPVAVDVLAIAAVSVAASVIYENGNRWLNDVAVVANPGKYSDSDLGEARHDIRTLGAFTGQVALVGATSSIGTMIGGEINASVAASKAAASAATSDGVGIPKITSTTEE